MDAAQFAVGTEIHIDALGSRVHARIIASDGEMCEYVVMAQCSSKATAEGLAHGAFAVSMAARLGVEVVDHGSEDH